MGSHPKGSHYNSQSKIQNRKDNLQLENLAEVLRT
jgi:hypothetical protein